MWWITVGLVIVGILLMLVELLLVPGVGVAGFLGLASLVAACWYTFACIGYSGGWWVTVFVLAMLVVMTVVVLRNRTWKRFELKTEVNSRVNEESSLVNPGDKGVAQTRLAPMGTGRFGAVSCEVKSSDNSMIAAGTPLEVVAVENNQVIVKPLESNPK